MFQAEAEAEAAKDDVLIQLYVGAKLGVGLGGELSRGEALEEGRYALGVVGKGGGEDDAGEALLQQQRDEGRVASSGFAGAAGYQNNDAIFGIGPVGEAVDVGEGDANSLVAGGVRHVQRGAVKVGVDENDIAGSGGKFMQQRGPGGDAGRWKSARCS